jgi:hypothetical protein
LPHTVIRHDLLFEKVVHVLRCVARNVYSDFGHCFDGEGMDVPGRLAAGAGNAKFVFGGGAKDALSHVTAAGIASAKDED